MASWWALRLRHRVSAPASAPRPGTRKLTGAGTRPSFPSVTALMLAMATRNVGLPDVKNPNVENHCDTWRDASTGVAPSLLGLGLEYSIGECDGRRVVLQRGAGQLRRVWGSRRTQHGCASRRRPAEGHPPIRSAPRRGRNDSAARPPQDLLPRGPKGSWSATTLRRSLQTSTSSGRLPPGGPKAHASSSPRSAKGLVRMAQVMHGAGR